WRKERKPSTRVTYFHKRRGVGPLTSSFSSLASSLAAVPEPTAGHWLLTPPGWHLGTPAPPRRGAVPPQPSARECVPRVAPHRSCRSATKRSAPCHGHTNRWSFRTVYNSASGFPGVDSP